ncbi:acyltransferase family protein [Pedomonas sp. V897]|uniref:acyltransferase family protein n=1 Tax=Pedomonas sp. V897 TaxID=3446482 RepID=UPI003EE18EDC
MGTTAEVIPAQPQAAEPASRSGTFQQHIHIFRAVAICLIVGAHSVPSFDWKSAPMAGELIDSFCNQASIYFFFIAGYLFQFLSPRFSYGRYLTQKFKTVLLPYFLVSIPAIIISVWFIPQEGMWRWFYGLPAWQQIGLFYLTGKHLEPLWFVPTITLFYLAAPLLLALDRRPVLYWILPLLVALSVTLGRDGPWGPVNKAVYLLPAYLYGMAFSHFRKEGERLGQMLLVPLLAVAVACYVMLVVAPPARGDLQMLFKLAMCPVLIVLFKALVDRIGSRLDYVAHVSFGIFFVHAYFISAFRLLWTKAAGKEWAGEASTALFPPSVLLFLLHALMVLAVSVAIIWGVQKVFPRHSRQLVGA